MTQEKLKEKIRGIIHLSCWIRPSSKEGAERLETIAVEGVTAFFIEYAKSLQKKAFKAGWLESGYYSKDDKGRIWQQGSIVDLDKLTEDYLTINEKTNL
jgi:hypothetical protein